MLTFLDRPVSRAYREKGYLECDHPDCIVREEKIKKLQELVRVSRAEDRYNSSCGGFGSSVPFLMKGLYLSVVYSGIFFLFPRHLAVV